MIIGLILGSNRKNIITYKHKPSLKKLLGKKSIEEIADEFGVTERTIITGKEKFGL